MGDTTAAIDTTGRDVVIDSRGTIVAEFDSSQKPAPAARRILLSALHDPRYFGPGIGEMLEREAPPVLSAEDVSAKRMAQSRQVMRHYSLTVMLRQAGIRRSISKRCQCGRPISANKNHCATCAPKE